MDQFLLASAVVPSLMLMLYFQKRDLFPEPTEVIWATFGLGVLSVIPILIVGIPTSSFFSQNFSGFSLGFFEAFIVAALIEEFFKFLVVRYYSFRHSAFDEPMDGVVYGVAASLGFATLENILYVSSHGFSVALLRAVSAVPCHAFFGAIMGYYLGQSKFNQGNTGIMSKAFWIPVLLHGAYDFPLLSTKHVGKPDILLTMMLFMAPVLVITMGIWSYKIAKNLRLEQLASRPTKEEVALQQFGAVQESMTSERPEQAVKDIPSGKQGLGVLLVVVGFFLGSFGGLITLGLLISPSSFTEDLWATLLALVLGGIAPLAIGLLSFYKGITHLNRSHSKI